MDSALSIQCSAARWCATQDCLPAERKNLQERSGCPQRKRCVGRRSSKQRPPTPVAAAQRPPPSSSSGERGRGGRALFIPTIPKFPTPHEGLTQPNKADRNAQSKLLDSFCTISVGSAVPMYYRYTVYTHTSSSLLTTRGDGWAADGPGHIQKKASIYPVPPPRVFRTCESDMWYRSLGHHARAHDTICLRGYL